MSDLPSAAPVQSHAYPSPTPVVQPTSETARAYEYTTFPRAFVTYRWFKPILVFLLGFVFLFVFSFALLGVAAAAAGSIDFIANMGFSYDDMDAYTAPGALVNLGSVAIMLAALALAALIVRDRPYSSYSSSRGGWNWGAFAKCLLVAFAVVGIPLVVQTIFFPLESGDGIIRFTAPGLVLCILLVPLQCIAEEYVFRGWLMQTIGAWTKLPVLAVLVQSLAFAAMHPYNLIGVVAIFINGLAWGIIAWQTKGLEASSAVHIANNMVAFLTTGFGIEALSSEVDLIALVLDIVVTGAYLAVILYINHTRNWFSVKKDGAAAFNAKRLARTAQRAQTLEQDYGQGTPSPAHGYWQGTQHAAQNYWQGAQGPVQSPTPGFRQPTHTQQQDYWQGVPQERSGRY